MTTAVANHSPAFTVEEEQLLRTVKGHASPQHKGISPDEVSLIHRHLDEANRILKEQAERAAKNPTPRKAQPAADSEDANRSPSTMSAGFDDEALAELEAISFARKVEEILLRVGDDVIHQGLMNLVNQGLHRLSFAQFVSKLQDEVHQIEEKRLGHIEEQYIHSMGVDRQSEQKELGSFRAQKSFRLERKPSVVTIVDNHSDEGTGSRGNSVALDGTTNSDTNNGTVTSLGRKASLGRRASIPIVPRSPSVPNDVECYKEEFGYIEDAAPL